VTTIVASFVLCSPLLQAASQRPGRPVLQSATADQQAGAVIVAFAPPTSDGGSPITGYQVRCREANTVATIALTSPATLTGLPRGRDLTFEVVAVNGTGPGPASAPSKAITLGQSVDRQTRAGAALDLGPPPRAD
jgi:hypothetical protein